MAKAIETGVPKMRIEESAARKQAKIDSGSDVIVGVNAYQNDEESDINTLDIDNTKVRTEQVDRLQSLKAERDTSKVEQYLSELTASAKSGDGNLLEIAVNAARERATLGEISDAMEEAFGRYKAT